MTSVDSGDRLAVRPLSRWKSAILIAVVTALAIAAAAIAGAVVAGARLGDRRLLVVLAVGTALGVLALARRDRLLVALGAFAYVAALHAVYVLQIAPNWGYAGLVDPAADPLAVVIVSLLAVAPVPFLPLTARRPSEVVIWILYLVGFVPTMIMPLYVLYGDLGRVSPLLLLVAVAFGLLLVVPRLPLLSIGVARISIQRFDRALVAAACLCIAFLIAFFGVPTGIPDFTSVYDARAEFAATQVSVPFGGYISAWAGNVIFPMLIALGIARPRWRYLALGIAGEFLLYVLQGSKASLFLIPLVPFVAVAIRLGRRRFGPLVIWGGVAMVLVAAALTALMDSPWPLALSVVRLIALPGQLTADYFDYFSTHAPYLLSHSILRGFVDAPYPVDPPFLIGAAYLHHVVDANASFWADSIANFGLAGIIPFTAILGAILWLLDVVAAKKSLVIVGPAIAIFALTLSNGALLTAVLTNGIGLALLLVYLLPPGQSETPEPAGVVAAHGGPLEVGAGG